MAANYMNESYDRCMAELRARYSGRGVSVNVKNTARAQIATERRDAIASAESRITYDRVSGISNEYRSGEYKGSKYMTSDDFVRYFRNRESYSMPTSLKSAQQSMDAKAQRSQSLATRRGGSAVDSMVSTESSSKEGHLKTRIETFIKKWFPAEPTKGRSIGERLRLPTAAIGGMAAFALSLGLIVGGSVMIGNASSEVGSLNATISHLQTEETELQSQLDLKYNVQDIEEDAKTLGMINKEYARKAYLEVGEDEEIEIYEQEDTKVGLAALLNALGFKVN